MYARRQMSMNHCAAFSLCVRVTAGFALIVPSPHYVPQIWKRFRPSNAKTLAAPRHARTSLLAVSFLVVLYGAPYGSVNYRYVRFHSAGRPPNNDNPIFKAGLRANSNHRYRRHRLEAAYHPACLSCVALHLAHLHSRTFIPEWGWKRRVGLSACAKRVYSVLQNARGYRVKYVKAHSAAS